MCGEQEPSCQPADRNAVLAGVVGVDVLVALGIIEFRRRALDDDARLRPLAEIDARLRHPGSARRGRRNVLQIESRQPFGLRLCHGQHHHIVVVSEQQMQVDPGLRVLLPTPCLYPESPPLCPCRVHRNPVSSPRLIARSKRFSRTVRTCTLHIKVYGTS